MRFALPVLLPLCACLACSSDKEQSREGAPVDPREPAPTAAAKPEAPPPPPYGNAAADDAERALVQGFERPLYDALEARKAAQLPAEALELACVHDGLSDDAFTRLAEAAAAQQIPLGPLRLIRLEGPGGAPASACRPVAEAAAPLAPLFRVREPAATWRLRPLDTGAPLEPALVALAEGARPAAPPRVLVVDDARVAAALPTQD